MTTDRYLLLQMAFLFQQIELDGAGFYFIVNGLSQSKWSTFSMLIVGKRKTSWSLSHRETRIALY